jgi:hypothetical protein
MWGDGKDLNRPVRTHVEAALVPVDAPYPSPVEQLKRLGDTEQNPDISVHARRLGLTQEHVPDLVRMARDRALHIADSEATESWAPIYALQALKAFDLSQFVVDLIPLFDIESDWVGELIPKVLADVGSVGIEPLSNYLRDRSRWVYGRIASSTALTEIAKQSPELRDRVVAILTDELGHGTHGDLVIDGFLLADLLDLKAIESLPVIRHAFERDVVDETVAGDWAEVLQELGQEPDVDDPLVEISARRRKTRHEAMFKPQVPPTIQAITQSFSGKRSATSSKQKQKRKAAKQSRKKNRRH